MQPQITCPYCGVPFDPTKPGVVYEGDLLESEGSGGQVLRVQCPNPKCKGWVELKPKK